MINSYNIWKGRDSSKWLLGFASCLIDIIDFCPELTIKGILSLRRDKGRSFQLLSACVAVRVKGLVRERFVSTKDHHGLSWWLGLCNDSAGLWLETVPKYDTLAMNPIEFSSAVRFRYFKKMKGYF